MMAARVLELWSQHMHLLEPRMYQLTFIAAVAAYVYFDGAQFVLQ